MQARPCRCRAYGSPTGRNVILVLCPLLQLTERSHYRYLIASSAYPDRHWDSPVPLPRYAPVGRVIEYVILPLPNLLRMPLHLLIRLDEPLLYPLNVEEPLLRREEYQFVGAPPAVGIAVAYRAFVSEAACSRDPLSPSCWHPPVWKCPQ